MDSPCFEIIRTACADLGLRAGDLFTGKCLGRPRSKESQQAICAAWKLLETTTYQGFVAHECDRMREKLRNGT
ncbi:MAG: hypothetical protein KME31_07935 [Tolypothrix carrinoi HA7290-LM1]|nr:hypothetical protein [Tolypothrix carrinoi HA7290-LM1]